MFRRKTHDFGAQGKTFLPALALTLLITSLAGSSCRADDLLSVYQLALQSAPELRAAGFKLEVGEAQKGQAFGQLLPQISGVANWSENSLNLVATSATQNYTGTRYFVSLTQSLMDFAKFWEWRRTHSLERQLDAERTNAQNTLIYEVTRRYFAILDAQDQLRLTNHERQMYEQLSEQINVLFSKQLAKITDVYEVESRLDQIKADEIEAESQLVTARQSLSEQTNAPPLELAPLRKQVVFQALDGKLEDWLEVARSENPMVTAQHLAVESAENEVAVKKSRYLPVVDLQLYFYDTDTGYQNVRTGHYQNQVAALNVNVPIFNGGSTTAAVSEAQSKAALAREEREAKTRALIKETSEAFTLSNANAKRIEATEKALSSAQKSQQAMLTSFNYGVKSIREVLEAVQHEHKTERELSRAKYNYIVNRMRFQKAIGAISEDNLLEINGWLQE